jgi:TetR/AcrR family transcriptional repressor of nem operon
MGRCKEFDPGEVLSSAQQCFKEHGYSGASMSTLCECMGIGRASIYATYGDKKQLFLAALSDYVNATVAFMIGRLEGAENPADEVRSLMRDIAEWSCQAEGKHGCFLANSATELGSSDPEIQAFIAKSYTRLEDGYCRALERAQENGQLARDKNPRALARFFLSTIQGMRVIGKARPDQDTMRDIAESALTCLD